MYLKKLTHKGVTRLYFYESYYENGKVRQRMIEPLGRLDALSQQYDDPIAHFKQLAKQRTQEQHQSRETTITIDRTALLSTTEDNLKNVGYGILKELYRQLQLDTFWKQKLKKHQLPYDVEAIFQLLVYSRVLFPASKKRTYENRTTFFEPFEGFTLDQVYRALDWIARYQEDLQQWIYDHSSSLCERDCSVAYFDCTNYYFDISRPDLDLHDEEGNPVDAKGLATDARYRKRGPEKNHRRDPIVSMGLLMDRNGIPLAFDLFPGNESEKLHMRPIVNRLKTQYTDCRTIFVADRGLNTSDNIYYLNGDNRGAENSRDGYVYGQSVRGADAEFKQWVLKDDYRKDTLHDEDGNPILFCHKSRIHPKTIHVNVTVPGSNKKKKKDVVIDQKQMVYYSEKYARKQRLERSIMVERAKDLIAHPKKYDRATCAGSASYIENLHFDKETGEIAEGHTLSLKEDKIAEEEQYDGYYSIVTSELQMEDLELRRIYRGLCRIEDTFKLSKSDFEARPVFVSTNTHIDAHFTTCFTALVLIRLLQSKLGAPYPAGSIIESLRKYNCVHLDANQFQFVYYDSILAACSEAFHIPLDAKYKTRLQIRRMLHY